ncbi:MAG: L,D-transpeptidase family protein [Patescibacteria group bacterium]
MHNILVTSDGILTFNGKKYRCALGKGGVRMDHVEGDEATPVGCFPIRKVFYRPDKFKKAPETVFPTQALQMDDGWCDDVNRPEYNKYVKLPYDGSHEKLWRDDHLYDIIVVLGHNDDPPVPSKGSAIFMHVARETYTPTLGCIALSQDDLLELLKTADPSTQVRVSY